MITYEEALEIVLKEASFIGAEEVLLENSLGRILAEDITADIDMPLFNKSRMDGYACRMEDITSELDVIDTIYAGELSQHKITQNKAVKIMTGSAVPEGADCVIKVEETEQLAENKIVFKGSKTDCNISFQGEDFKKGDILLNKGIIISPQHIAILATAGKSKLKVAVRPNVSLLVTGNELSDIDKPLEAGHIRDSNTPQLKSQIKAMGAELVFASRVGDTLDDTISSLKKAMECSNLILLSGGVSMGDYDFVPKAITELGGKIIVEKVAVKPGKPFKFAVLGNTFCLGLPGNPVSSFVQFEILAKPFLYKLMGCHYKQNIVELTLAEDFVRKDTRKEWYPVEFLDNRTVKPRKQKSSGDIASLAYADGLMIIERNILELKKGTKVNVRLLRS